MKVVIAAGGRFHSLHLAHQLQKRKALKKLFTFSYAKSDENYVSKNLVCNSNFNKILDFIFSKFKLSKFVKKSNYYVFSDNLFDYWLNQKIKKTGEIDIFVGWANYFLKSLPQIRKTNAKIIVECGSCHVLEQLEILKEEYKNFGLTYPPVCQKNISKVLEEYGQSDYIMTCSNFTYKSFIKHGIKENKILKVPYGVDLDFFLNENPSIHRAVARRATADTQGERTIKNKFRVICVGLLGLRKGIPYLLQAWNKLNLPKDKTELLLVGNVQKDLRQVLKNIKISENVKFFGATDRQTLRKLYQESSLFVLPSIEEGLSMVIAEAMASGLPVICTTNTGGEDLIENGKQGFIIPIRNIDALAEKILWCYKNYDASYQMGLLGQEKAKLFSWDNYGEKVFDVYKKILDKS